MKHVFLTKALRRILAVHYHIMVILCSGCLSTSEERHTRTCINRDNINQCRDEFLISLESRNRRMVKRDSEGNVVLVRLGSVDGSDRNIELISSAHTLKSVFITCSNNISSDGIKPLLRLHSLCELEITVPGLHVSEEFIRELKNNENLDTLHLNYVVINRAGIKHIGEFKGLRNLYLIGVGLCDADLDEIVRLKKLVYLDMRGNILHDEAIDILADLPVLKALGVDAKMTRHTQNKMAHIKLFGDIESK